MLVIKKRRAADVNGAVTCAGGGVEAGVAFQRLDDVSRVRAAYERQVEVMLEAVQLIGRVDDGVPRPEAQEKFV